MGEEKGLRLQEERAKNRLRGVGRRWSRDKVLWGVGRLGIRFLLGMILAGGRVLDGAAPFGVAFVAASGTGSQGIFALGGTLLGYLFSLGLEDGLRYSAGAILVFALAFAFGDNAFCRRRHFMPLAAGGLELLTGVVTMSRSGFTAAAMANLAGETAFCVLGVYAFRSGVAFLEQRGGTASSRQRLGLGLTALAVVTSLSGMKLLGTLSVGHLGCALAALVCGYAGGFGTGAALGLAGGLTQDLAQGNLGICGVSFALGGWMAGLLREQSRSVAAGGFALAWGLVTMWYWESVGEIWVLYEMPVVWLMFLLLPKGWLDRVRALLRPEEGPALTQGTLDSVQRRLSQAAEAFGAVFDALRNGFPPGRQRQADPAEIMDLAAESVCVKCGLREKCWQRDYNDTHDLLNGALEDICRENRVDTGFFPPRFRDQCCRFPAFFAAVERQWQNYLLRRQLQRRLEESRAVLRDQYGTLAKALEEAAETMAEAVTVDTARTRKLTQFLAGRELQCRGQVYFDRERHLRLSIEGPDAKALAGEVGSESLSSLLELPLLELPGGENFLVFRQREPLTITAALAGDAKAGEALSGDAGLWFKDEAGRCYIILCDGMGSGPAARRDSRFTLEILEKFLRSGITPENALKTLDQALALRFEGEGGFAAVDLMTLDLFSGQGELYKLGSPASYLKRGGTVVKLSGKALPAGVELRERELEKICFRLSPGDCLLLITDGVLEGEDGWLRDALSDFEVGSPADFARMVTLHNPQRSDDRTALVVRVGLRTEESL